jgi:hypothetical protein
MQPNDMINVIALINIQSAPFILYFDFKTINASNGSFMLETTEGFEPPKLVDTLPDPGLLTGR